MSERMKRAYIADLRREIAKLKKESKRWEMRTRYLEAKRIELQQAEASYAESYQGEGTA